MTHVPIVHVVMDTPCEFYMGDERVVFHTAQAVTTDGVPAFPGVNNVTRPMIWAYDDNARSTPFTWDAAAAADPLSDHMWLRHGIVCTADKELELASHCGTGCRTAR
jgi:hypothetical protein